MTFTIVRRFVPMAFLATMVCGLVYLVAQQSLRTEANDPQIQMAEDTAAGLQGFVVAPGLVPSDSVDISTSLAPYVVIYNSSGTPVAGNGFLQGTLPNLPAGVFAYVQAHGEDQFTWQPRPSVRQAVVITSFNSVKTPNFPDSYPNSGFVMAGRSLREVEIRENQVEFETDIAWIPTLIGLFILEIFFAVAEERIAKKKNQ